MVIFLSLLLAVMPIKLTVELKKESLNEGLPVQGELTISHQKDQEVNPKSATLEGKSLELHFVKEVATPTGLKTTYGFQMTKKPVGLQILQPISVEVGGETSKSPRVTYEVMGQGVSAAPTVKDGLIFKLEPFVEGRKVFYPRQRAEVGYRYIFNDNVELKKEELPLIEPKGFKKIGNEQVQNVRKEDVAVREIRQKIEAVTPGKYSIGPSSIVGLTYTLSLGDIKEYADKPVEATAPAIELEIRAFPEKGKPPSFNGAIGKDLQFTVTLQSFNDVTIGDKITIALQISGDGEVENAPMPDICCQPGFPGKFRQSDIPPAEIFKHGIKFSVIDLVPLSTSVKEIPSVEFSFFNPDDETYKTIKTEPIPIKVRPTSAGVKEIPDEVPAKPAPTETDWPELSAKPQAIDIATIYALTPDDLKSRFLGSPKSLWILLLGPLLLGVQIMMRQRLHKKTEEIKIEQKNQWSDIPDDDPDLTQKITEALFTEMRAKGLITTEQSVQELPNTEVVGEVKEFLTRIEEERFSKMKRMDPSTLKSEGKRLFNKIRGANGTH